METKKAIINFGIALAIVVTLAAGFGIRSASAATLSISPSSGTYFSGRSFTVAVKVSSPDQAMNAVQGEVSFPVNKLQVLSISKAGSVLNLWVQDPAFSNQSGVVNFAGVATNPGFQGSNGTVITITFAAKNTGDAQLSLISPSVLANDGNGTNILTGVQGADFTIAPLASGGGAVTAPEIEIVSTPPIVAGTWYNLNNITFDWSVPVGADGVDYTISTNPNFQIPDVDQGLVSQASYDLSNFGDGPWYFFVSFESGNSWSPPIIKKFLLDRTQPAPFVITREDLSDANTRPGFAWAATDAASGIDHYAVRIGDGDWFNASLVQNGSSSYILPLQSPTAGRVLTVRAYDAAGNYRDSSVDFSVLASAAPCAGAGFLWCELSRGFPVAGWLVILLLVGLLLAGYGFVHLLLWKKKITTDLKRFEGALRKDLDKIEKTVSARTIENEVGRVSSEVEEEIRRLSKEK